jgi:hypothetical protein
MNFLSFLLCKSWGTVVLSAPAVRGTWHNPLAEQGLRRKGAGKSLGCTFSVWVQGVCRDTMRLIPRPCAGESPARPLAKWPGGPARPPSTGSTSPPPTRKKVPGWPGGCWPGRGEVANSASAQAHRLTRQPFGSPSEFANPAATAWRTRFQPPAWAPPPALVGKAALPVECKVQCVTALANGDPEAGRRRVAVPLGEGDSLSNELDTLAVGGRVRSLRQQLEAAARTFEGDRGPQWASRLADVYLADCESRWRKPGGQERPPQALEGPRRPRAARPPPRYHTSPCRG